MAGSAGRFGFGHYAELFRQPHVAPLLGWGIVSRLCVGMTPLALLLVVRDEGFSYTAAGAVTAGYTVALGLGAPYSGRRVDRRGRLRVLLPRAILYPAALGAVAVLGVTGGPIVALGCAAAVAGLLMPPVGASIRTLLPALAPGDLRSTAFALEAALQEVFFVAGPLLVALLATIGPVAALVGAAATAFVGTVALTRLPPIRETVPPTAGAGHWIGSLGAPGVQTILGLAVFMGLAFGPLEVAMPGFAEQHGSRELAGLALASFSGGSLVGGLLVGLRRGVDDRTRLRLFAAVLPVGLALPLLATSIPLMCALIFLAGLPIAPLITGAYGLVDRVAPPGTHAETFAWIGTAITAGISTGTALGGWLVDAHGVRVTIACGVAAAVLGALFVAARRGTLHGVTALVAAEA